MKRVIITLLLLIFCLKVFAQTPIKHFLDSVNWSMTESEFIQAWQPSIEKVDHFNNEYGKWYCDYQVKDITLGDLNLSASVNIDEESKKLVALAISVEPTDDYMAVMNHVEQLLRDLYGEPELIDDKLNGQYLNYKDVKWFTDKYSLKLGLSVYPSMQFITIRAEEYTGGETDIRGVKWGDSKAKVMAKEGKANQVSMPDLYAFEDEIAGMPCFVGYEFTNDKLSMVRYIINQKHSNKNDYITDYNRIVGLLTKKYGEPYYNAPNWKNSLYKDDPSDYGLAISIGHLYYNAAWSKEKMDIGVYLYGENYEITFIIQYDSKKYKQAAEEKKDQEALDML